MDNQGVTPHGFPAHLDKESTQCYTRGEKEGKTPDGGKAMDKDQRRAAKAQLVAGMQTGQSWQTAAAQAGLQISQSNAYRLWAAFRQRGETALNDGRHGHPIKLRGEARTFLENACREAPQTPSSTIQAALRERFDLSMSISQINRVRTTLGISNRPQSQEQGKKRK
jgi:transposase